MSLNMDIVTSYISEYDIGNVIDIRKAQQGSGDVFLIYTSEKKYILKLGQREDFARVQELVSRIFQDNGIATNTVIRTKTGGLLAQEDTLMLGYVDGYTESKFSQDTLAAAIQYLIKVHSVLSKINIGSIHLDCLNEWDQAKSIERTINYIDSSELSIYNKSRIGKVMEFAQDYLCNIDEHSQLIHNDLGPDNFVLQDRKFVGIIDFTPHIESVHYSFAQFMYWNVVWNNKTVKYEELAKIFDMYNQFTYVQSSNRTLLLFLIKVSIYRFSAPLIKAIVTTNNDISHLDERIKIAEHLIGLYNCIAV